MKANGLIEASTIVAILLGSVTGGFLSDYHITMALILCTVMYALAAVTNIYIPRLPPAKTGLSRNPRTMVVTFFRAVVSLWKTRKPFFPDRYQSVLGRGRDTAADAGIVGSGGAGYYRPDHADTA